jgi:hypothetical protein
MAGLATPRHFTPKSMASFSRKRIARMGDALLEIAGCYGDVDQMIVDECDRLRDEFSQLLELVEEAEREGKTL